MTKPSPKANLANLTASAIIETARQHREANRTKEALALLEVANQLWPENGRVRHQLGLALLWDGDASAVGHLLEAARQDPKDVDRLADLAECLESIGDRNAAALCFRRMLVQAPARPDLVVRCGLMFSRSGDDQAAETWMRRALGLRHPFGHAYVTLGEILKGRGRIAEAIECFRRSVLTDPDYTLGFSSLSCLLRDVGAPMEQAMVPGRIWAERMPERMEAVIPMVSYLRDIGEEAESVRFASRFLSRQMEDAARDEIGQHGIRVLHPDNLIERLELVMQLDLHIKMKMLGWLPPFITVLLAPKERVVNATMLDYYRPFVTVVDDPKLIEMMGPLRNRVPYNPVWVQLPDGRGFSKSRAYFVVQEEWQRQGREPLLTLTPVHAQRGRRELKRMGVPDGAWFVGLHVREPGYANEGPNSSEAARNADILAYLPAVEEIVRRGGWVIRLGDPSMKPLPPMAQVIDYAVSPFKSEETDVFLMASCRFLLGTTSGPVVVSEVFGVPVGAADYFPIGGLLHTPKDVIIPRPYREKATGRMLYFEEYLKMPLAYTYDSNHFASYGLEALPSEPEDILDLAIEMLERTEGKWPYDAEDEKLNARWHEIARPFTLGQVGCRVGRGFLRRHRHLFESV
jgi:putative glycosyltransferase (TIGR04372 family)